MTTRTVPTRACLAGEDLDWLGGRSLTVALGLTTTVAIEAAPRTASGPHARRWAADVWAFLRTRVGDLPVAPPPTTVHSDAPVASGLSSSTALIVALFLAYTDTLARPVPVSEIAQWAYEFEFAYCNGGGMDQLAVLLGGTVLFDGRPTGLPDVRDQLPFPAAWSLVVVDSATAKSTPPHIRTVRARLAAGDPRLAAYTRIADHAAADAWTAITHTDLPALADATTRAHIAMRDHQGMSTPLLERLRDLARDTVALPLKLSGAGGGGALVGVCRTTDAADLTAELRRAYARTHPDTRVLTTHAAPIRHHHEGPVADAATTTPDARIR